MDWKELPRTRDKVAIVGFHDKTRHLAPFEDDSYEIWTLNEEYNFPWVKRMTRHFQLHPRWDFSRTNNLNDPNHFKWLKNETGECTYCKGIGKVQDKDCIFCENGIYSPPASREGLPIYMQKAWDDIPNCIELPLTEITREFLPKNMPNIHYYTSSVAYMLGLAMLMGFKRIEFYGFDMGSETEYHYQRANFEYWIGLAHGRGFEVVLPGSAILTGKLYGYENMHIGFRQQLEMRTFELNKQFTATKTKVFRLEAQLDLLKQMGEGTPELDFSEVKKELKTQLQKKQGLLNFISGAKTETDNLTKLYEGYMKPGVTDEEIAHPAYAENAHVGVQYVESNNA